MLTNSISNSFKWTSWLGEKEDVKGESTDPQQPPRDGWMDTGPPGGGMDEATAKLPTKAEKSIQ